MNLIKASLKASGLLLGIVTCLFLTSFLLIRWQEGKLEKKASNIKRDMGLLDVAKIMGTPQYMGLTDSPNIPKTQNSEWETGFQEMKKRSGEYFVICNYFVEYCWFPFTKKMSGNLIISIYLSHPERRVIYVAEHGGFE